ncbi:hypothetical protein L6R52_10310, partial [Myxococcota bacterium]|nr:hypothetical protein [Myxococcota bacterium]
MNAPSTRTDLLAVRWIYLRLLGLVSLAAFLSAGAQLEGLVGSRGILPVATTIERFGASLTGVERWLELPTLFWLGASDAALGFVSGLGALVSLGLVIGVWPRAMLVAAWALYLSIQVAGRSFFAFQWDILLVEVLFASILFAPRGLWRPGLADDAPPSTVSLMLVRLVAF